MRFAVKVAVMLGLGRFQRQLALLRGYHGYASCIRLCHL